MKLSEVTEDTAARYLRVDDEEEKALLPAILASARSYVLEYTGLTLERADAFEDLTIAALCLCGDFYDSRSMTVQNDRLNPVAAQILAMHSVNLL